MEWVVNEEDLKLMSKYNELVDERGGLHKLLFYSGMDVRRGFDIDNVTCRSQFTGKISKGERYRGFRREDESFLKAIGLLKHKQINMDNEFIV